MKRLVLFNFVLILVASSYSFAAKDSHEIKRVMHQVLDSIIHLSPYISSEMKFKDPRFEKEISRHLIKLSTSFKQAKHNKEFKTPGFYPSYQIIQEHLEDTTLSFQTNNKNFARMRLASTASLCLSCHTQLPKNKVTTYILDHKKIKKELFENNFEYANFLFLLREYKKAIQAFEIAIHERFEKQRELNKIQKILGSDTMQFDRFLYNSFQSILTIYTKVLKQPKLAIDLFRKYSEDKRMPRYMNRELYKWIKDLKRWAEVKEIEHTITNDKEMNLFMDKYLSKLENEGETVISGKYDVDLLITSGILSNYLNTHPQTSLAPQILYWLGISENRLDKNIFFTLGDVYLKECIRRYPKDPTAIKCYLEYENEVTFRFTGSIGTHIPKAKQKELMHLKSLIK